MVTAARPGAAPTGLSTALRRESSPLPLAIFVLSNAVIVSSLFLAASSQRYWLATGALSIAIATVCVSHSPRRALLAVGPPSWLLISSIVGVTIYRGSLLSNSSFHAALPHGDKYVVGTAFTVASLGYLIGAQSFVSIGIRAGSAQTCSSGGPATQSIPSRTASLVAVGALGGAAVGVLAGGTELLVRDAYLDGDWASPVVFRWAGVFTLPIVVAASWASFSDRRRLVRFSGTGAVLVVLVGQLAAASREAALTTLAAGVLPLLMGGPSRKSVRRFVGAVVVAGVVYTLALDWRSVEAGDGNHGLGPYVTATARAPERAVPDPIQILDTVFRGFATTDSMIAVEADVTAESMMVEVFPPFTPTSDRWDEIKDGMRLGDFTPFSAIGTLYIWFPVSLLAYFAVLGVVARFSGRQIGRFLGARGRGGEGEIWACVVFVFVAAIATSYNVRVVSNFGYLVGFASAAAAIASSLVERRH